MKTRYRLTCRGIRGGKYYCVDNSTGKRASLRTTNADEARQIVEAKNNSERQPVLNLHIAKAYLAGSDNGITTRTWQHAIESLINMKEGANQERWRTAAKDKALAPLLPHVIIETQGELLLKVLQMGTVSTNVYLRRLHNFCVDILVATCILYQQAHDSWLWFGLLFLAPDFSMLGYLASKKASATVYNLGHTYAAPFLLLLVLWLSGQTSYAWLALIWLAHIGFDRMLGYGLKYETAFKDTHLQRV